MITVSETEQVLAALYKEENQHILDIFQETGQKWDEYLDGIRFAIRTVRDIQHG